MKTITVVFLLGLMSTLALGFDRSDNPDRYASIGVDLSNGKQAGFLKDHPEGFPHSDGGFVKGALDARVPITNVLTLHAFGSSTGINNNLQYSDGHEIGLGIRVFLK